MSLTSKDAGTELERLVADRLDLDRVSDDAAGYVDAYSKAGDPVDVKGARKWYTNRSRRRRGRWWIQKDNHLQLKRERGFYALAVYHVVDDDPDDPELAIDHLAVLPARYLDPLLGDWVTVPEDHVAETSGAAQLSWGHVFGTHRQAAADGGERR